MANATAPFPPPELMLVNAGTDSQVHFAQHGIDIFNALQHASPKPLMNFESILDFGVGCGRLARMFWGFRGRYVGIDIDPRHVDWVASALPFVHTKVTTPNAPIDLAEQFEAVISVSVFSHLDEASHLHYLAELHRLTRPGGYLFITIHGERGLQQAETSPEILRLLHVPRSEIDATRKSFTSGTGYHFILRSDVYLTTAEYPYGITFISADYVNLRWSRLFEVVGISQGAIHDFQDIVLLRKRRSSSGV